MNTEAEKLPKLQSMSFSIEAVVISSQSEADNTSTAVAAAGRSPESVLGELQIVEVEEERRRGAVLWYSQLHSPHIVHRLAGFSNSDINVQQYLLFGGGF